MEVEKSGVLTKYEAVDLHLLERCSDADLAIARQTTCSTFNLNGVNIALNQTLKYFENESDESETEDCATKVSRSSLKRMASNMHNSMGKIPASKLISKSNNIKKIASTNSTIQKTKAFRKTRLNSEMF